ncbi:MAG: cation diffusion facilitator family transporter [Candidatus Marinimicrobia bacterium]|nr:cation diffusion facilitator family transporter [Candidatus Neomarinimicrobiota bacterium]
MAHNHIRKSGDYIGLAFGLNLVFALFELFGGLWINSMAVISDALHDFGDSMSLGFVWYFKRIARRQQDNRFTYGYQRYALLGAIVNMIVLIIGSLIVLSQAMPRLLHLVKPNSTGMLIFAIFGILVNGLVVYRMRGQRSLAEQAVTWHMMEDVLGWIAVLIVSLVLKFTNWYFLDPLLSIIIMVFILYKVIGNFRKTMAVFLQSAPENINNDEINRQLSKLEKVKSAHHTHIWSLDGEHNVLTTHIVVEADTTRAEVQNIKNRIKTLTESYHCEHLTVEIEYEDEDCSMNKNEHS